MDRHRKRGLSSGGRGYHKGDYSMTDIDPWEESHHIPLLRAVEYSLMFWAFNEKRGRHK